MTKNSGLEWCEDDENLLAKLWREGLPKPEIAERLGRTTQSIERKASAIGLLPRSARAEWKRGVEIDSMAAMEKKMRDQDRRFISAMLEAGYVMTQRSLTLNSSGSSR